MYPGRPRDSSGMFDSPVKTAIRTVDEIYAALFEFLRKHNGVVHIPVTALAVDHRDAEEKAACRAARRREQPRVSSSAKRMCSFEDRRHRRRFGRLPTGERN